MDEKDGDRLAAIRNGSIDGCSLGQSLQTCPNHDDEKAVKKFLRCDQKPRSIDKKYLCILGRIILPNQTYQPTNQPSKQTGKSTFYWVFLLVLYRFTLVLLWARSLTYDHRHQLSIPVQVVCIVQSILWLLMYLFSIHSEIFFCCCQTIM